MFYSLSKTALIDNIDFTGALSPILALYKVAYATASSERTNSHEAFPIRRIEIQVSLFHLTCIISFEICSSRTLELAF
jgi:hypothetical protein